MTRKADEIEFYRRVWNEGRRHKRGNGPGSIGGVITVGSKTPRTIANEMGLNENRAYYLCSKWCDLGWLDYGVNALAGWLTLEAPEKLDP